MEEYDDLKADAPSCGPGTKRRLMDSLFLHPEFEGVSNEAVKQHINDFVQKHIRKKL